MVIPITQAIYAFAHTITSSPSCIPKSRKLIHKASNPLANPTQYFVPIYSAHSFSNASTSFPKIYHPESSTEIAFSLYSSACKEYCLPKLFGIIILNISFVTYPIKITK